MHRSKTGNFAFSVFNSNIIKWILRNFYIVLVIPLFLYSSPLFQSGISIAGDFPYLDTSHYSADKLWMWVDKGSRDGFEFLARYSIISIWYGLNFLNFGSDLATKAMIISGFFLSSFCFYFTFLRFFKIKHLDSNFALKLSAVVGSLFYTYNVWSFNRIHHYYLWIGYTILPLFILSIYYSFRNPKNWKYIVLSTLLWSFASITAHMVIFYGIILVCTFFGFIINDLYTRKRNVTKLVIPLILIISFYALVNMYWIYPYGIASQIRVPNPPYELTKESLELLSRESNFLNSFRIMAYWLNAGVDISDNQIYSSFWTITTFVVPLTAFTALLIRRSIKFAVVFAAAALISIFLTMGTRSPINYYDLALNIPIVSKFVWIFRDPEKWAFIAVFAFSFMIGIVSYKLLKSVSKENYDKKKIIVVGSIMLFLMASIFLSSYPFYSARMEPLIPVQLPSEFDKLNTYLNTIDTDRVYFIPYPMKETDWDKNGVVQNIYNAHSIKPSIDSSEYYPMASTYYNYLVNTVMENRSNGISNLVNPLGTSYLIFHNDSWNKFRDKYDEASIEFLNKLQQIKDVRSINDIGFYNIFRTSNNNSAESTMRQLDISHQSIGVIGGLDIFGSLESVPTFNSKRSSLLFLDDIRPVNKNAVVNGFNDLLLDRSPSDDEFALSFLDRRYMLTPFDHTISNDPTKVWSKSGARDPIHGAFHPDLKRLGIENWDFDYGEGLVKTRAVTNMSMPIEMKDLGSNDSDTNNNYHLFMRYFKNQKGGPMKIYLDDKMLNEINGFDRLSNNFMWQEIGTVQLPNERHELTLENVGGFNAVNIFALIPETDLDKLRSESEEVLADKSQVIYLLEAESSFNNIKGKDSTLTQLIDQNQSSNNDTIVKNITGQFKVPKNSDLVSLKFQANKSQMYGNFLVDGIQIHPGQDKYTTFVSDFERTEQSIPLATLRYSDWFNLDKNFSSTSTFVGKATFGNKSLKVELKPSDGGGWDTIATNFIPISDDAYYNASLHLDARDVIQLHSKILFFDSKKIEFSDSPHFILDGKDGTFSDTFSSIVVPPNGAKYIKIQVLARTANPVPSNYILDNVKFEEIVFPGIMKNSAGNTFDISTNIDKFDKGDVLENESFINDTYYDVETIPYLVKADHTYDYNISIKGNNISSYNATASFGNSNDVSENATKYGNNASNGRVLTLDGGSEIHMRLNIIKADNYTIALKANACNTCTYLTTSLESIDSHKPSKDLLIGKYNLKHNDTMLKWVYSNSSFNLLQGIYDLTIHSQSVTDLDIVAVYPTENASSLENTDRLPETSPIESIFETENSKVLPAKISKYQKVNPTKHVLQIVNATRPYVISFAESYDPLWQARIDRAETDGTNGVLENNYRTNSMPLYGLTNGFYINKTGNYEVVLEYSPQVWFGQGLVISIFALATMAVIILIQNSRKRFLKYMKAKI